MGTAPGEKLSPVNRNNKCDFPTALSPISRIFMVSIAARCVSRSVAIQPLQHFFYLSMPRKKKDGGKERLVFRGCLKMVDPDECLIIARVSRSYCK
jgi:hypothetical protein